MGEAEVEVVRALYEHWDRRDYAATIPLFDPDVEFARIGSQFADLAGEWRGLAEMWQAAVEFLRPWEDLRQEPERFIDLGDRVLVLLTQIGKGRGSGVVVERPVSFLFSFRDGKIVRVEGYWDQAEGVRAAGHENPPP